MGISSFIIKTLARKTFKRVIREQSLAISNQNDLFKKIVSRGFSSLFGKNLDIKANLDYGSFSKLIPISTYEDYREYISLVSLGKKNILTNGRPMYFAITSGTTSGTKYIPLTKEMWRHQSNSIKDLLLLYAHQTSNYDYVRSGMMFVQGSPELKYFNQVPFGRLSGIAARHIPFFLKNNRYPSMATNKIPNWSDKINAIVSETYNKNMKIIGGIPPWVMTYFDCLLEYTGKHHVKEVFPGLSLYIHGGTSFGAYRKTFLNMCGPIDTLEVYPASEGFFAFQNNLYDESLLLLTNRGVFYEFITLSNFQKKKMERIPLEGVELNIDYVLIVTTVAGLWAYNTGDTVRFVSKNPYKIIFSGRASQFCSAFGEHVIEKEIQTALKLAINTVGGTVSEFSVCPKVGLGRETSRHDWFIEFLEKPKSIADFEAVLQNSMKKQNIYYKDLFDSGVIGVLKIILVKKGGFSSYMKSIGKFGGQNKCPHLLNDRRIADFLLNKYVEN
tara:strand:- start:9634 stop:11133 length:1500 start_codon:yes stop_codon:yes gene_type:complete